MTGNTKDERKEKGEPRLARQCNREKQNPRRGEEKIGLGGSRWLAKRDCGNWDLGGESKVVGVS